MNEDGTTNDNYNESKQHRIMGVPLEYVEAPDPTDIIWENIEWPDHYRTKATGCVFIVSTILLLLTLLMFIGIKSKAGQVQIMYPPRMDCKSIDSMFTTISGDVSIINQKKYSEFAAPDKNMTHEFIGGGYYQCYCTKFSNYQVFKQRAE